MTDSKPNPRQERIPIDSIQTDPVTAPLLDEIFMRLMEESLDGKLQVFFAAVPMDLLHPFDPAYDPEDIPGGAQAVEYIFQQARKGDFPHLIVYPSDDVYVVSDDYAKLAALRRGQPDFAACWVLGQPAVPGVKDIQGPIAKDQLKKVFGLE